MDDECSIGFPRFLNEEFDFLKFKFDGDDRKYILTKPKEKIDIRINTIKKLQNHSSSYIAPVSLFAQLKNNKDERAQMALEKIIIDI